MNTDPLKFVAQFFDGKNWVNFGFAGNLENAISIASYFPGTRVVDSSGQEKWSQPLKEHIGSTNDTTT